MDLDELWKTVHTRFDPAAPPESGWRVDRTDRSLQRIQERLHRPFEQPRILVSGTVGAGKTTQMLRLAEERARRDQVIFFDVQQHLESVLGDVDALESIEAWEVAALVGLAVGRQLSGEPTWNQGLLGELDQAWEALLPPPAPDQKRTDLGKLLPALTLQVSKLVSGSWVLDTLAGAMGAVRWDRRIGNAQPTGVKDQDPRVRRLLNAVNALLAEAQRIAVGSKKVLFCLDGLDRIRNLDRAESLFVRSGLLGLLDCGLLINAPYVMRHHVMLAEVRGFHPIFLVNEPVLDQDAPADPNRLGKGVDFFEHLFAERVKDIIEQRGGRILATPEVLRTLAWRSGGRAREFVLLVREAAGLAWTRKVDTLSAAIVDEVTDQRRRLLESGLRAHHVAILVAVRDQWRSPLPNDRAVDELLQLGRLLPYPDGSEWFFPHPLLLPYLERSRRDASPRWGVPPEAGSSGA